MAAVYHWKHGWIPLDHAAALSKAKGDHAAATRMLSTANAHDAGMHSRQDIAKAIADVPNLPNAVEKHNAIIEIADAAQKHNAVDLLPNGWEQHSPNGKTGPGSTVTKNGNLYHAAGHDGTDLGHHNTRREANKATDQHYQKTFGTRYPNARANLTDAQMAETNQRLQHNNLAQKVRNQPGAHGLDPVRLAELASSEHLSPEDRNRAQRELDQAAERRIAGVANVDADMLAHARRLAPSPTNDALVRAIEKKLGAPSTTPTGARGTSTPSTESARLEAAAQAKRAEAQRIFDSTGAPDRAGARLNAANLKQAHKGTDSALRRYTEATQAADALHGKALLAASREREAARVRLTAEDLAGATHVVDNHGMLHEVVRVNKKTVTVKTPYSWTDTIAHEKIARVHRATPAAVPSPAAEIPHGFKVDKTPAGYEVRDQFGVKISTEPTEALARARAQKQGEKQAGAGKVPARAAADLTPAQLKAQNSGGFKVGDKVRIKVAGGTATGTVTEIQDSGVPRVHVPGHGTVSRSAENLVADNKTPKAGSATAEAARRFAKTPTARLEQVLASPAWDAETKAAVRLELERRKTRGLK